MRGGCPTAFPRRRRSSRSAHFFLRTESELVLKSRRVVPGRLLDAGFEFKFPDWPEAAEDLVQAVAASRLTTEGVYRYSFGVMSVTGRSQCASKNLKSPLLFFLDMSPDPAIAP